MAIYIQKGRLIRKKYILFTFIFLSLVLWSFRSSKCQTITDEGEYLFKVNCSVCHSLKKNENLIGPTLYLITKRKSEKWIFMHVVDAEFQANNGDKRAIYLRNKYKNLSHPKFEELSGDKIKSIITFLKKTNN